ncbi:hypothetical protein Trydic_g1692 [Trypoxylus dichotomus]
MKKYRPEGRNIVYTDELRKNTGLFADKVWNNDTITSKRQELVECVTTGKAALHGRGQRYAIQAGNENGFVTDATLTLLCKKNTADTHGEVCRDAYEKWFTEQLLPILPPNSVIVIDNAPHYSRRTERILRSNDIEFWLESKHVPVEEGLLKGDLLHIL